MLTKDDISQISTVVEENNSVLRKELSGVIEQNNKVLRQEIAEVIEQNITPALDSLGEKIDKVENRLGEVEQRFNIVEHKLDRVLYNELDKHERWIKQLASKVGLELKA